MKLLIIGGSIVFLYFILSFLNQLIGKKKINLDNPKWKRYNIKKGKSNFWPLEPWFIYLNPKGFDFAIIFPEEAYISKAEWENDKDWDDWNKALGLTQAYSFNSSNSAMVAFNWGELPNTFRISGYTNYPGSQYQWSDSLIFKAGDIAHGTCRFEGNEAIYELKCGDQTINWTTPFSKSSRFLMRRVGTSIGGANNSPGKYGGKSTKDFYLHQIIVIK